MCSKNCKGHKAPREAAIAAAETKQISKEQEQAAIRIRNLVQQAQGVLASIKPEDRDAVQLSIDDITELLQDLSNQLNSVKEGDTYNV